MIIVLQPKPSNICILRSEQSLLRTIAGTKTIVISISSLFDVLKKDDIHWNTEFASTKLYIFNSYKEMNQTIINQIIILFINEQDFIIIIIIMLCEWQLYLDFVRKCIYSMHSCLALLSRHAYVFHRNICNNITLSIGVNSPFICTCKYNIKLNIHIYQHFFSWVLALSIYEISKKKNLICSSCPNLYPKIAELLNLRQI